MTKKKFDLHYLVTLALLTALMLVMDVTGLAMIPLPGQYASIMTGSNQLCHGAEDRLQHLDSGRLRRL